MADMARLPETADVMLTEHEPPERVQPLLGVNETNPVGVLTLPDVVSTTVTVHVRPTPTTPISGQVTAVEVCSIGIGETSTVVEKVAVCWGEPLFWIVSVTVKLPAEEYM